MTATASASVHPLVGDAATHLLKAGGKRLRPALVLISARAGEPGARASDLAAAAVELVHVATLYHDDVIDQTATRRGVPTAHTRWGTEVAVLAGDYLFACGCALGAEAGGEVPGILARAIARVCEGQIMETATLGDPYREPADYLTTIERKTGALFEAACELGATTSGAPAEARRALASFGSKLGTAFQIVDDILDLTGDPRVTGKVPGTDLSEGVFTLPVLIACERDGGLAERLIAGERSLEAVLPSLESTGALTEAHTRAEAVGAEARAELEEWKGFPWTDVLATIVDGVFAQV